MLPTNPLLRATAPAGPHLPLATLRQYAAGTLAPAVQHRVEAHALACPRCADVLEGLLQTPPATTDQALAQLQQRLRRRVQLAPQALPATRAHHRHRLMALQLAAAATLLFGLVAGGWWTWQQRHARPAASPIAAVETPPRAVAASAAPAQPQAAPLAALAPAAVAPGHYAVTRSKAVARSLARQVPQARPPVAAAPAEPVGETAPARAVVAAPSAPTAPIATLNEVEPFSAKSKVVSRVDSATLSGRMALTKPANPAAAAAAALLRTDAMPAAPAIAPAPVGGYGSWREKLRREAAEFKPELPEQPLSGSVQLRLLIGADGKIQEMRVLHGLRADYDEEAQRLVCDGANWVPGIGGGKRAAQPVDVAVPFQ